MPLEVAETIAKRERGRLVELEGVIRHGLSTFIEVGNALMEIRDSKLYRATHKTFDDYCRERWGFSDSRGRQLISAAKAVTAGNGFEGRPVPKTEREARRVIAASRLETAAANGKTERERQVPRPSLFSPARRLF